MENDHNKKIEKVASLLVKDKVSLDEHNADKLKKYYDFVRVNYNLVGKPAAELINEAFLYLKLKQADDIDPLQQGDKFGAGFS